MLWWLLTISQKKKSSTIILVMVWQTIIPQLLAQTENTPLGSPSHRSRLLTRPKTTIINDTHRGIFNSGNHSLPTMTESRETYEKSRDLSVRRLSNERQLSAEAENPKRMHPKSSFSWNQKEIANAHSRLYRDLFSSYLKHVRPVKNHRTAVNVTIKLLFSAVIEVQEELQTVRYSSYVDIRWTDEFLAWDPDDYDGLKEVEIPNDLLWKPTLFIENGASGDGLLTSSAAARVRWDGEIMWAPLVCLEIHCKMDISIYPFDTQICPIIISPWTATDSEINVTSVMPDYEAKFEENLEWQLNKLDRSKYTEIFENQTYTKHRIFVHLKRRRLFHSLTLIVPNVLLALLSVLVFALPVEGGGEKVSFSTALLLAFAVNLSVLVDRMPVSSLHLSYLVVYLSALSFSTALSILMTVFLLALYHKPGCPGPRVAALTLWLGAMTRWAPAQARGRAGPVKPSDDREISSAWDAKPASGFDTPGDSVSDVLALSKTDNTVCNGRPGHSVAADRQPFNADKESKASESDSPGAEQELPGLTCWRQAAEVLERVCLAGFFFAFLAMTSTLVGVLFLDA